MIITLCPYKAAKERARMMERVAIHACSDYVLYASSVASISGSHKTPVFSQCVTSSHRHQINRRSCIIKLTICASEPQRKRRFHKGLEERPLWPGKGGKALWLQAFVKFSVIYNPYSPIVLKQVKLTQFFRTLTDFEVLRNAKKQTLQVQLPSDVRQSVCDVCAHAFTPLLFPSHRVATAQREPLMEGEPQGK